jgi:hypothetical protein
MKMLGIIILTVVGLVAGKYIANKVFTPKDPNPPPPGVEYGSLEHLRIITKEISATLPKDIDSETRLTKVWARESELVYDVRLINHASKNIDRDKFLDEAGKHIRKAACAEPRMKLLWKHGIMVTYQVQGNDGFGIGMISVGGRDCL